MCLYDCVCALFWDPILLSYTPSLALQLSSPSPPLLLSLRPVTTRAAHTSPPPIHATPPPSSPSLLLKLFQQEGREREKVTNHAVSEKEPFPPLLCVCMNFCMCAFVDDLILLCVHAFILFRKLHSDK
ncbi:Hypothetical predicted protein [Xyrichtys novacula]|uniref:Uncharacterized protein n=1 Tax=Xyrichtys novacula TaxID=13765 RepID=A0AAV1EQX8_XYRNO|nr:Hypothetical predicted protein [Xyrichtys novacula]